jgi:hypothetical protein
MEPRVRLDSVLRLALYSLLALLVFAPAATAFGGKQATFDIKVTGHYSYDHTEATVPGANCPFHRGNVHRSQVLDFNAHYRAKLQTAYGRWYTTLIHASGNGPGKLHQTSTTTAEVQYCGSAVWEPDQFGGNDPPVDKTCSRPVLAVPDLGAKKGKVRFFPGGFYHGKCEFGNSVEPLPLGFDKLNILYGKINTGKLKRTRAALDVKQSDSKTQSHNESDSAGNVTTITDRYDGTWTVTFKRKGPWRVWR